MREEAKRVGVDKGDQEIESKGRTKKAHDQNDRVIWKRSLGGGAEKPMS